MKALTIFTVILLFVFVSANAQSNVLYSNSANHIRLSDYELESDDKSYEILGGRIFGEAEGASLKIIPLSGEVSIKGVRSYTKKDTVVIFKVISPPLPVLVTTWVENPNPIHADSLWAVYCQPDSAYAVRCPLDINYLMQNPYTLVPRGQGAPLRISLLGEKESDRCHVRGSGPGGNGNSFFGVKKVVRINAEGRRINQPLDKKGRMVRIR